MFLIFSTLRFLLLLLVDVHQFCQIGQTQTRVREREKMEKQNNRLTIERVKHTISHAVFSEQPVFAIPDPFDGYDLTELRESTDSLLR